GELPRGRAFGTEPAFVHRAVGVALDLEELGLSVDLFRVRDERAPHGAIGANGVDFLGAGDPQVDRPFLRGSEIKTERIREWNERHTGGAGGSELQELTASDFRHRNRPRFTPEVPEAQARR